MIGASAARQRVSEHAVRRVRRLEARRRAAARIGLSGAHISPRSWAEWTPQGNYLAVHVGRKQACPVPGATRGVVHGFSRQSRSRLLKTLAKVDRSVSSTALFVTLTYPSSFTEAASLCKSHLDSFVKRLHRKFVRLAIIWRLELTEAGTPHFHLIVFGARFIPHEWVARAWAGVCNTGHPDHERTGTETRRVVSFTQAFGYAAKYVAKVAEGATFHTSGRVWGVAGRRHLPIRVCQWELDGRGEARLTRAIRDLVGSRSKRANASPWPPRWLIMPGARGERLIGWSAGLPGY